MDRSVSIPILISLITGLGVRYKMSLNQTTLYGVKNPGDGTVLKRYEVAANVLGILAVLINILSCQTGDLDINPD